MINKRIKILTDLQEEMNKIKSLLDESMENDANFHAIQEESAKFKEETKMKKERLMANPSVKAMQEQLKKIRDDVKETKEILSQELADYYKESGSLEYTDDSGETKRIIFSVKLVNS